MRVLVSGASGLVGSAVVQALVRSGNDVRKLVREKQKNDKTQENGIAWNVETGGVDEKALKEWDGPEAMIHLAGESIGSGRWTEEKKRRIRESRVETTQRLAKSLARVGGVKVFVGASAIGFYGDRGDEVLTEASSRGTGFLAETCEQWEAAAEPLLAGGARVVHLRFGMILSATGGALAKMLPIFQLGLGGKLGNGRQWVSWASRNDVVRAIEFAVHQSSVAGPHNVVAPNPVRNMEFTQELGKAIRRPTFLPAPGFALRMVFGEMAEGLLLSSQRVTSERLMQSGFKFEQPTLREALKACL